jgi:Cellulase (glycosyl hydrolase family 5)
MRSGHPWNSLPAQEGSVHTAFGTRRARGSFASLALAALVPLILSPSARAAGPVHPAVTTSGVRFVDRSGRIVILRGVDIGYRSAYAAKVVEVHANFARVRVLWADLEPRRGRFASAELRRLDAMVAYLTSHRVNVELDLRGKTLPGWVNRRGFDVRHAPVPRGVYLDFVRAIVSRYMTNARVIGFGILNEPHPYVWNHVGSPRLSRTMLAWQAPIRDAILAVDPSTTVFFNVRGGNLGTKTCFRCAGFRTAHTVLDFHDFYNGCCGSGFDATADNWIPSWSETHNQLSTRYLGTARNQWLNLAVPWRRTHLLGIPMIVGEWGVRNDDVRNHVYDEQMERILGRHGLSWARWDMDCVSRLGLVSHGKLNEQGRWLASELGGGGG